MATTKDPEIQKQSQLVRNVVANLNIGFPEPVELRFRTSLLACCAEVLGKLTASQVTRLYEAACDVKFASEDVKGFRDKLQRIIAKDLDLSRFKVARRTATPPAK